MSACRLVAEELELSERTVEEIWAERKERVTRPTVLRTNSPVEFPGTTSRANWLN